MHTRMNQKQGGSNYLKTEEQTLWGRNKAARTKENAVPIEVSKRQVVLLLPILQMP